MMQSSLSRKQFFHVKIRYSYEYNNKQNTLRRLKLIQGIIQKKHTQNRHLNSSQQPQQLNIWTKKAFFIKIPSTLCIHVIKRKPNA